MASDVELLIKTRFTSRSGNQSSSNADAVSIVLLVDRDVELVNFNLWKPLSCRAEHRAISMKLERSDVQLFQFLNRKHERHSATIMS